MSFGALNNQVVGSHTEDEWQALVRKYGWRCFYCGSPMSAWRSSDGRILQIRNRNVDRPWESSGKVMSHVSPSRDTGVIEAENVLTKDHLIPISRGGVDFIHNIRPADFRCNKLKGPRTIQEFLSDRYGFIMGWLESLPADDWRVQEWNHWHSDEEIEQAIDDRLAGRHYMIVAKNAPKNPQPVDGKAQESTGVFALASDFALASAVDFDLDVEKENKASASALALALAVPPLPLPYDEDGLMGKVVAERERTSWAWKNPRKKRA